MAASHFAVFHWRWRLFREAALAALAEDIHGHTEGQQHRPHQRFALMPRLFS